MFQVHVLQETHPCQTKPTIVYIYAKKFQSCHFYFTAMVMPDLILYMNNWRSLQTPKTTSPAEQNHAQTSIPLKRLPVVNMALRWMVVGLVQLPKWVLVKFSQSASQIKTPSDPSECVYLMQFPLLGTDSKQRPAKNTAHRNCLHAQFQV